MARKATAPDLTALSASWALSLRADRKSLQTIKAYGDGLRFYLAWCGESAVDPLDRGSLRAWVAKLLDDGAEPATARSRQLAVRRFTAWLTEEGEIPSDPFLGVKAPKLDTKVIEPLSDDELRRLLKACTPPRGSTPTEMVRHRRDEAILRLMLETGIRAGEVVNLEMDDVDLAAGLATVRRGKGGKGRVVPFGPQTALAIDRYLRVRTGHRLAATSSDLWLGDRGKGFTYDALHKTLAGRAVAAGIPGFHPHRMRHTAAHRWLAAGGSEGGLMAVAGWTRPDMLMRYTKAQAARALPKKRAVSTSATLVRESTAWRLERRALFDKHSVTCQTFDGDRTLSGRRYSEDQQRSFSGCLESGAMPILGVMLTDGVDTEARCLEWSQR